MRDFLDRKLIGAKYRMKDAFVNFCKSQQGDSNFVAIIVIIVIILAVAGIFRTQIINATNSVFENLTDFIG